MDHKVGWTLKNWCFWTVVLKTLENPLDCKEIKPVNPKGNQPWNIHWKDWCWSWSSSIWPPDGKCWLIGKDPDAGKVKVKVAQPCPTFCNPMDYRIHEILQARILEWIAFAFSRGSSQPRDRTQVSFIAGRFFTSWATREAWCWKRLKANRESGGKG